MELILTLTLMTGWILVSEWRIRNLNSRLEELEGIENPYEGSGISGKGAKITKEGNAFYARDWDLSTKSDKQSS